MPRRSRWPAFVIATTLIACGAPRVRPEPSELLTDHKGKTYRAQHYRCFDGDASMCSALATVLTYRAGGKNRQLCELAEVYGRKHCELDRSSKYCHQTPCESRKAFFDGHHSSDLLEPNTENSAAMNRALARLAGTPLEEAALRCHGGDAAACAKAAEVFDYGKHGIEVDERVGALLYRRACDGDDGFGCHMLSLAHGNGEGVPEDEKKASELLERAVALYERECAAGNGLSCTWRARLHEWAEEYDKAFPYWKRSCDLAADNQALCWGLALSHYHGRGTPEDQEACTRLAARMCDAEVLLGCELLGHLYIYGQGVAADVEKGLRLLNLACDGETASSCAMLATFYRDGEVDGLKRDEAKAEHFQQRACALGHKEGCP